MRPGAAFLGGGTNLVDLMKLGVVAPDMLVDVTGLLPDRIERTVKRDGEVGGGLRIGAGVRNSDLAADPQVRAEFPVLAQAVLAGASGQLRNMATVGGNLLQRTRCLYFQDVTKPCNKRMPGSGCPARAGDHRNLPILGGSPHCVATHPSDMAVALAALDALVHVEGAAGPRAIPLSGLYRLPGDEPDRETTLERGDLITAVEIPARRYAANSARTGSWPMPEADPAARPTSRRSRGRRPASPGRNALEGAGARGRVGLTRCAALLGWAADPGGEQVSEADHAVDAPPFHDRQVAEAVQEHDLGRVLDRRVPSRGLRIPGHPGRHRHRGEV